MTDASMRSPTAGVTSASGAPDTTSRAVARFYEQLVFPSRRSHADYAGLVEGTSGLRVGDFGCGQSLFYEALRRHQPLPVFLDLSMNALRSIDYGLRVRADLRQLPFPSATYDRILCIGVLHHLPARGPIFREVARVLRPGGRLVLGVYAPGSLQSRLRRLHDAGRLRIWRRLVLALTMQLIRARYRGAGRRLGADDVRARARDFLEVPYVQYSDPELYFHEAAAAGLRRAGLQRIAAMNVLFLERASGV